MPGKSYTRATAIFLPSYSLEPKEPPPPRGALYRVLRCRGCVVDTMWLLGDRLGAFSRLWGGFSRLWGGFCGLCGTRSDAPERDYEKLIMVDPFVYEAPFGQVLRYTLKLFQVADARVPYHSCPRDVHSGFVPRIIDGCSKDVKRLL